MNTTTTTKHDLIDYTRNVLRGKWTNSGELEKLYEELVEWDQFAYASEVLLTKLKQDQDAGKSVKLKEHQKLANLIYKDHSLPSSFKFDRALQELNTYDDLRLTTNCETLGLAGAIYKYKWLYDHQIKNLELSLHYYHRGFKSWSMYLENPLEVRTLWEKEIKDETREPDTRNDCGYTAINYAYILELMAIDKLEGVGNIMDVTQFVESQINTAHEVRKFIIDQFVDPDAGNLRKSDYKSWILATIAEAYFGLREYEMALTFINKYKQTKGDTSTSDDDKIIGWKIRTFTRQLFSIAYLQQIQLNWVATAQKNSKIKYSSFLFATGIDVVGMQECLHALSEKDGSLSDIEIRREGKVGIALSGGGFRASLFHIGVLAALAEHDKLKDIEVISCVSGGSIIGAYYYLELKKELEHSTEVNYFEIVKRVEENFLKGIQKNLRLRVINNIWCNLRIIFDKNYSRTHRLGELYEEHLYRQIDKDRKGPIYMDDLFIKPKNHSGDFDIYNHNFNRKHKVPQLILNATTVNTGHNWQFTASWMGEPPGSIQSDIDVKPRLRRMYYKDAPAKYKRFRLGYAVGASSCVPVLFTPMPLYNLYPDDPKKEKIELQLIDGGLHDNQGIASLIEQECKNMIISDASGQMATQTGASKNELSTFYRADTILQERIRELQFKDIKERAATTQINNVINLHLKNDLQQMPISWLHCTDPPRTIYNETSCENPNELTDYGILRNVQLLLSEIRTDLDSFNDTEAYALMYSGYAQTHYQLKIKEERSLTKTYNWQFLKIKEHMTIPERAEEIEKVLTTAKKVPFKLFDLSLGFKIIIYSLGIIASVVILVYGILYWNRPFYFSIQVGTFVFAFIVMLVGLFSKMLASWLNIKSFLRKKAIWIIVLTAAFIASNFYLIFLNGLYNSAGRLKKKQNVDPVR